MRERVSTAPLLGIRLVCSTDYSDSTAPRAYVESLTPAKGSAHVDLIDGELLDAEHKPVRDALADIANATWSIAFEALRMQGEGKYDWSNHPARKMEAEATNLLEVYDAAVLEAHANADRYNATHRWVTDCDGERRAVRVA